jgi:hypothetical protein
MFQPNAYYYPNQPQQSYAPRQVPYEMPQQNLLKGRFVSSVDEVRAAQVDFDGSIFVFPDMANKKIYTKQIDLNGNVKLEEYDWVPIEKTAAVGDFVTKQEFEETMAKVKEAISQATQPQVTPQPQSKEGFNF